MSHIGCLCGNDVRENDFDNVWHFVSFDLMEKFADNAPFFGLDYEPGEQSDVWHCKQCDRLILFDDGGNYVTRYMRVVAPDDLASIVSPSSARQGILYNEERFFDAVDEAISAKIDAGECPDYEFFDAAYAHGNPLLTPRIVRGMLLDGEKPLLHWYRAVMSEGGLAIFDSGDKALALPLKCWLTNAEDMAALRADKEQPPENPA